MAIFRQVKVCFWDDPYIENLDSSQKLFYLYCMTNARTTACGIYDITYTKISQQTGIPKKECEGLMKFFIQSKKLLYCEETFEIMMLNWIKHNEPKSIKIVTCIIKELKTVKNRALVSRYIALTKEFGIKYSITKEDIRPVYDALMLELGLSESDIEIKGNEEFEEEVVLPPRKPTEENKPAGIDCPYEKIIEIYNERCRSLPKAQALSDKRKKNLKTIWITYPDIKVWEDVFDKIENSDFLTGRTKNSTWKANFDFVVFDKFLKILEGSYDNREERTRGWS